MKHFYRLLLLIFALPLFSSAQSNYKPGYVVNAQGDTSKGYINVKEWDQNPRDIEFKTLQGEKLQYSDKNIISFGVDGYDIYRRYTLSISQGKVNLADLTTIADTSNHVDTVFLKLLTAGKYLTLYSYVDNIKERYFIDANNGHPMELIRRFYLNTDGSTIVTKKIFQHQLTLYALNYSPDDKQLTEKISTISYRDQDFQSVVNEINGENNKTTKNSGATRFFAGLSYINTSTNASGNIEFAGQKVSNSFPGLSLGLDVLPNKNIQTFFLRLELAFTQNKANFNIANSSYSASLSAKQFTASFNPQIMYNVFNAKDCKVYLSVGAALNYSTYSNKSYSQTIPGFATESFEYPDVKSIYAGISSKIGIQLNDKIEVYAGYNPKTALNDDTGYRIDVTQYKVGINYLFDRK